MQSYPSVEAGLQERDRILQSALSLADPTCTTGLSTGLAHNFQLLSLFVSDPSDLQRLQLESAIQAVELDQSDPFAHVMLGFANGFQGDMKGAESEPGRSAPSCAELHLTHTLPHTQIGQIAFGKRRG